MIRTMVNIKLIILFGSRARETAAESSDADIAILADHPLNMEEKMELGEKLAKKFNLSSERMDIIDLWIAPPLLQHQVAQTGKLLEGSDFDFMRFKVLAWKRYLDTAKFRRAREKALKQYAQRVNS